MTIHPPFVRHFLEDLVQQRVDRARSDYLDRDGVFRLETPDAVLQIQWKNGIVVDASIVPKRE